jgi:hypothetical protein
MTGLHLGTACLVPVANRDQILALWHPEIRRQVYVRRPPGSLIEIKYSKHSGILSSDERFTIGRSGSG